jgi:translation initiation factor IF-3
MKQKESENRINYSIKELTVRLVGDNVTNGVIDTKNAMKIAREMGLDLVEISGPANGNPPICRVVDYQKYLYDKKKKDKEQKKKQKLNQSEVKEIRMTPNIDEHDFNFKLNHAKNFLTNNDKVLVSVFFKGREITYKDQGQIVLLNFAKELEAIGVPEYLPKMEGKKMLMMIKPKPKK